MNLNYKHLHYFMTVAELGSIARAAEQLDLAPQTISAQLGLLEENIGKRLLERKGNRWRPTEAGALALKYAHDIFSTGKEMTDALRGIGIDKHIELNVGITDAIPKTVAYKLIMPALHLEQPVHLRCVEGSFTDLAEQLAKHSIDILIADRPMAHHLHIKADSHLLHEGALTFMARKDMLSNAPFPACLHDMPFLMPTEHHWLSRTLTDWFEDIQVRPRVTGRFDDSALLKAFAREGIGACCVPTLIAEDVQQEFGLVPFGHLDEPKERFYAITVKRRFAHPAVSAICDVSSQ